MYFENNVAGSTYLLQLMHEFGCKRVGVRSLDVTPGGICLQQQQHSTAGSKLLAAVLWRSDVLFKGSRVFRCWCRAVRLFGKGLLHGHTDFCVLCSCSGPEKCCSHIAWIATVLRRFRLVQSAVHRFLVVAIVVLNFQLMQKLAMVCRWMPNGRLINP